MIIVKPRMSIVCMLFLSCTLGGCVGKRPFREIQLCVQDKQGIMLFKDTLKSIARSQHMEFVDASSVTQKKLVSRKSSPNYKLVYVGINGKGGVGLEAGNLGLSAYEVAVGFSEGSNQEGAHRFANLVINKLRQRWTVYMVPPDQGALPMNSCGKIQKQ